MKFSTLLCCSLSLRRLLTEKPGNKTCVDCSQKNPQCSGKHRGLGVHISFVRSVTMDSWSEIQLRKMEVVGNENLNNFLSKYGIPKETDIVSKYNTNAASVYRNRTQTLADGKSWQDPLVVKESPIKGGGVSKKPSLSVGSGGRGGSSGGGMPVRSRSTKDMYKRSQLEASAAGKEETGKII